ADYPTVKKNFQKLLLNEPLTKVDFLKLKSYMLLVLGEEYRRRGWIMQLHMGAQRTTSTRLRNLAGPSGGFAGIGKSFDINSLCLFLDSLEQKGFLPET